VRKQEKEKLQVKKEIRIMSYEKKHACSFHPHWKRGRDWLSYENHAMFCAPCRKYAHTDLDRNSSFVVECDNFRLEAVKYHESCALQKLSVKADIKERNKAGSSQAQKIVEKML
jgi:hypothetical protein